MTTNLLVGFPDIPQSSIYWRSNQTWDTNWPLENNKSGPRHNITRLPTASPSTNLTRIDYDLGSSVTKASNFLIMARADLAQAASVSRVILRGSSSSAFAPSDISGLTLWLDATRNVTANATNQVGTWSDLSGGGRDFTQSTSANKPILTRADNKENVLPYSEEFDNAVWNGGGSTFVANSIANPLDSAITADTWKEDGSTGNHRITHDPTAIFFGGVSYRASIYIKTNGRTKFEFYLGRAAFSANPYVVFNVGAGTVQSSGSGGSGSIESLGSGWYRCSVTATAGVTGVGRMDLYLLNGGGSNNYTGDTTSGFYVYGGQFCESSADTTYLATTTIAQYRGVNGNRSVRFDGTDDSLATTATTGDLFTNSDHTTFMVINYLTDNGAGNDQYYLQGGTGAASFVLYESGGNITHGINDGAFRTASRAATIGNTYIIAVRHTGGNQYISLNNGTEGTSAAGNIATTSEVVRISGTGATTAVAGAVCEVITYNAAISSDNRTKVYEYLRDKWQTTAPKTDNTFSTATLYGPRSDDYVAEFTTSSAYRYWWVDLDCSASSSYAHSKLYFGSWIDFGDTVKDFQITRENTRATQFIAGSGAKHIGRNEQPKYRLNVEWEGITDDQLKDFVTKVADITYTKSGVFLYSSTSHEILDSQRLLHCKIIDFTSENVKTDYNNLRVEFEELVG